jgi:hypothetical protein
MSYSLKALNARLQTLGLHGPSDDNLPVRSPQSGEPFSPSSPHSTHPRQLGSALFSPDRKRYTTTDLRPSDSISMMHRHREPAKSRRGGTDVDGGEYGAGDYVSEGHQSYGTYGMTMNEPGPGEELEQLTAGVTSMWGNETR